MNRDTVVDTPRGPGRVSYAIATQPKGVLVLSHGAGKGIESPDLEALANHLPTQGWTVVLFEQPWRVAGRKIATAPPTLDEGLRFAVAVVRAELGEALPLVLGGRSAGARSAARCARELAALGCLVLAFPLHPPHRRESTRAAELQAVGVATLVIQGARDALGSPDEFEPWFPGSAPAPSDLVVVPMADHGFVAPKRAGIAPGVIWDLIGTASATWLTRLLAEPREQEGSSAGESTPCSRS